MAVPTRTNVAPQRDRDLEVVAHPHRQLGQHGRAAVEVAQRGERLERLRARRRDRRRAASSSARAARATAALARRAITSAISLGDAPAFCGSPPDVHLDEHRQRRRALLAPRACRARARATAESTVCTTCAYFADDLRLVRLQVPDEVPLEVGQVGERLGLRAELLRVVLAERALPRARTPRGSPRRGFVFDTATSFTSRGDRAPPRAPRARCASRTSARRSARLIAVPAVARATPSRRCRG